MKRDFIVALLGAILIACLLLWVANKRSPRKKGYFVSMIVMLVIGSVFCTFPIENLFYTFPTAESAAQYLHDGEVIGSVEGRDSCYLLFRVKEGEMSQVIIPKTEDGYKIAVGFSRKQVAHGMGAGGVVDVASIHGSSDYYVFAMGIVQGENVEIRDNRGTQFATSVDKSQHLEENGLVSFRTYARLEEYTEGYQVIVENTEITDAIDVEPGGFLSSWVRSITEGIGEMMGQ